MTNQHRVVLDDSDLGRSHSVWLIAMASAGFVIEAPDGLVPSAQHVDPGSHVIGRSFDAGLRFDVDSVSDRHALVTWDGRSLSVTDMNSTNGTFVNGDRILDPVILRNGDRVQVGGVVMLVQVSADAAPSAASFDVDRQEGEIISNIGGDQYNVTQSESDLAQWREVMRTPGWGRRLAILGILVVVGAWLGFMSLIFTGTIDDSPFERRLFGIPMALMFFGLFIAGGVISVLGFTIAGGKRPDRKPRQGF